jgi:uncharacterized protein (DUF1697 family)
LQEVTSLLASGNLVFATDSTEYLEARLGTALQAPLGFEVDVSARNG